MKVIYHIENRGSSFIYHWFMYMVAGFRHIKNGNPTSGIGGSGRFEKNVHLYNDLMNKPPYYIFIKNFDGIDYQLQTLDLIKDEFILTDQINDDDIVINNFGENLHMMDGDHIHNQWVQNSESDYEDKIECYNFIKSFENKITITDDDILKYKGKKFFLSRNKSHLLDGNSNLKRRHILNEDDILSSLSEYNIERIYLEDYDLIEKIKLFKLSDLIISPNSAGLLFSIYSSSSTKIVELNVSNPHQMSQQYLDICKSFKIPYLKINCEKVDHDDNMIVDINILMDELKNNKFL